MSSAIEVVTRSEIALNLVAPVKNWLDFLDFLDMDKEHNL